MSEVIAVAAESQDELPPRPVEVFSGGGLALTAFQPQGRVHAGVVARASDVFAFKLEGGLAPRFDRGPRVSGDDFGFNSRVSIDVSRATSFADAQLQFTPVQGSLWTRRGRAHRFELSYGVGFGVVRTVDDLQQLQCPGDPLCEATKRQVHPTTTLGAGLRLWMSDRTALRFDVASSRYLETIASTALDVKADTVLSVGLSVAFPGGRGAIDVDEPALAELPKARSGSSAWFAKADLGAAAWLGDYGPSSDWLLSPAPAMGLSGGWSARGPQGKNTTSVELALTSAVHRGVDFKVQDQRIRGGEQDRGTWMQGDTHTFAALAIGTWTHAVTPAVALGMRAGGGVMAGPLGIPHLAMDELDFPANSGLHPQLVAGPVVEVQTAREGLSLGLNSDFVYAAGFDYGANVGAFAKVAFR